MVGVAISALPATVEVVVWERQPIGIGRIHDETYLVDERGVVIDQYGPQYADLDLPVIGDLEKGFGDTPADAAETIRQGAAAGLVGGSIEDATGNKEAPLFDIDAQVARVKAAAEAARALGFPFVLTARAEGFLRGRADLDDVIRRLKAFEAAGADVLMAPGLPDLDSVRRQARENAAVIGIAAGRRFEIPRHGEGQPLHHTGASYHARATCDSEIVTRIAFSSLPSRPSPPSRAAFANWS